MMAAISLASVTEIDTPEKKQLFGSR